MTTTAMLAVLTDNTVDGMVLGYARTKKEAVRVANERHKEHGGTHDIVVGARIKPAHLWYDPDVHTMGEVETVNAAGRAWIVEIANA